MYKLFASFWDRIHKLILINFLFIFINLWFWLLKIKNFLVPLVFLDNIFFHLKFFIPFVRNVFVHLFDLSWFKLVIHISILRIFCRNYSTICQYLLVIVFWLLPLLWISVLCKVWAIKFFEFSVHICKFLYFIILQYILHTFLPRYLFRYLPLILTFKYINCFEFVIIF